MIGSRWLELQASNSAEARAADHRRATLGTRRLFSSAITRATNRLSKMSVGIRGPQNSMTARAPLRALTPSQQHSLPLATHDFGGNGHGQTLLLLHPNGLHSHVLLPLVDVMRHHFGRIIAIDAPGQGSSPPWIANTKEDATPWAIIELVYQQLTTLKLKGCYVMGHSMGGCVAALIESAYPGTFKGMYVYEPPFSTPSGAEAEAQRALHGGVRDNFKVLCKLASLRRSCFPSQATAHASFASKHPFSSWHPRTLELYVRHGTRRAQLLPEREGEVSEVHADRPQAATLSSGAPYWHEGPVELCCSPATEGLVYASVIPMPVLPRQALPQCPVAWAVGCAANGVHARLQALGSDCVQDLPHGCLRSFPGLSHFGPLEDPERIASDVIQFFNHEVCDFEATRRLPFQGRRSVVLGSGNQGDAEAEAAYSVCQAASIPASEQYFSEDAGPLSKL